jgi:hypothetical protein
MVRRVSPDSSIYGNRQGSAAFLDAPEGVIPPPVIGLDLAYLGSAADVANLAVRSAGSQENLAALLGVFQQSVSRWVTGSASPRMSDEQWAKMIIAAIAALDRA